MHSSGKLQLRPAILVILLALASPGVARVLFVDAGAEGANNGSSWADACNYVQDALMNATEGDEIRVARGTYKPDEGAGLQRGNRLASFGLRRGLTLKGGYAGSSGPDPNERDIGLYETILSGDFNGDDMPGFENNGENAYHVVLGNGTDETTFLDGFTITAGNADAPRTGSGWPNFHGGGMWCYHGRPNVINCTFRDNSAVAWAGALYHQGSGMNVTNCRFEHNIAELGGAVWHAGRITMTGCVFAINRADWEGGAMFIQESTAELYECFFSNNTSHTDGGGLYIGQDANPALANCIFTENTAANCGGAVYTTQGPASYNSGPGYEPMFINCMFKDNSAGERGGGLANNHDMLRVASCIFWGNSPEQIVHVSSSDSVIVYSLIQGGWPGQGNIDAEPMLAPDGYHLLEGSPCIDAGEPDPNYKPQTDIDGQPRVGMGRVDIGPDEFFYSTPTMTVSAQSFQFVGCLDCPNPDSQDLFIHNGGENPFDWEIAADCPWLLASPSSGRAEGVNKSLVVLTANTSGMSGGQYGCRLTITSEQAANAPQTVDVNLVVTVPQIALSSSILKFATGTDGANPSSQTLTIYNANPGTLNWTINSDCNWLTVDPNTGASTPQTPGSAVLSVDASSLKVGAHTCTITVEDLKASNSPQQVTVTVYIAGASIHVPAEVGTIQEAIDHVLEGGSVIVADGIYTGPGNRDINFKGKAITVRSENGPEKCIIDCNGAGNDPHRGFYFHSNEDANSLLDGFTIRNGLHNNGGAVYCINSSPRIINCIISGNSRGPDGAEGGGIYCWHSSLILENSVISSNMAAWGAGIYCRDGAPTITNCIISTNTATRSGGGVYCYGGTPTITQCTFSTNTAQEGGGGIYCYSGTPTITNCMLTANATEGIGGGIYCDGGTPTITNCILSANTTEGAGGGMHFHYCRPTVANCTITANTAAHGGGLCCRDNCTLVLTGSIIRANQAAVGPQVALGDPLPIPVGPRGESPAPDTASISYCNLQGGESEIYMRRDTFFAWGPGNIDLDPAFVDPNAADYHLSFQSPCVNTGDPNFTPAPGETDVYGNTRIINGRIDIGAAELDYEGPLLGVSPRRLEFYTHVEDYDPSGRTLSVGDIGTGEIEWSISSDCSWLSVNPASGQSAERLDHVAIDVNISGLDPCMYTCELTIASHQAPNSLLKVPVTLYIGSTLYVPAQYPTIQAAIGAATEADFIMVADGIYTGGGNRGIDFNGKTIALRSENGPEFATIDCGYRGRGFYFHSAENADSVVDGFTITNGFAEFGAGIYCYRSSPTITNCIITDNMAIGADQSYIPPPRIDCGGGIYCEHASPTITDCLIAGNWSYQYGGGIYCSNGSAPKLANSVVAGNSAAEGGGIYFRDCPQTSPTITDSAFIGNAAGAMGNSPVGGLGGGMCNYNTCPVLTRCEFRYNWAAAEGAGIFNSGGSPTLTNCIFSGNSAERYAGAIRTTGNGSAVLTNCTLTGSSAPERGSIYNSGSLLTITNSILWNNTPRQLYDNYSPYTVVTYSNVEGGFSGLGNIDIDPCFVDPGCWVHADDLTMLVEPNDPDALWLDGDYHLRSTGRRWDAENIAWTQDNVTSRCIDAGDPASLLGDELVSLPKDANNDHGYNPRINMGAYGGTAHASIAPDKWALLADYNNDGIVNFTDYLCLFWEGLESDDPPRGDLDASGKVDLLDLTLLADDWLAQTTWFETPGPAVFPPYLGPGYPAPKPRACFPGDTPVWVDGILTQISTVAAGRTVTTANRALATAHLGQVEMLQEHEGQYQCYDVAIETGDRISVADSHYFLTLEGCWAPVQDLTSGSKLRAAGGIVTVKSVRKRPLPFVGKVYNLKIKGSDRYLVGRDALIVRDF